MIPGKEKYYDKYWELDTEKHPDIPSDHNLWQHWNKEDGHTLNKREWMI